MTTLQESGATHFRVFRAGPVELDEARVELRVAGERRTLEAKPMALLHALLLRGGAAAGKQELIQAVWGNADHTSSASLATAISKIRAALGAPGRGLVEIVHGSGYRIAARVEIITEPGPVGRPAMALQAGGGVPARPGWTLERSLGGGASPRVWLARCARTGETRVLRFAASADEQARLHARLAAARTLHIVLGSRADIVPVIGSRLDEAPRFIEMPQGGPDLAAWAGTADGLASQPLAARVWMIAGLARTVAACHAAGVLLGDLKSTSLLVDLRPGAAPALCIADSGGANAACPATPAPERVAGGAPTIAADVYALGVLLYQMVVGDLSRVLGVGWEDDVGDTLLRQDIAEAAASDPARRLTSAAALAERLDALPLRRAALQSRERERAQAAALARQWERARLRRPWKIAAAASLCLGVACSTIFAIRALHARDEAAHRAQLAQSVNTFLTQDLFGRGNPAQSGKPDESLMDAAEAAEAGIDRRLGNDPLVAGAIYLSLARAYDSRSAFDAGRRAYRGAIDHFGRAGDAGRAAAVIARLQLAVMEVTSLQPDSLGRARGLVAEAAPSIAQLGPRRAEAETWLADARATLEMTGGDVAKAQVYFTQAADRADALPEVFDAATRLTLRQHEGFTYGRLGAWDRAEAMLSDVARRELALNGPRHPDTLGVQLDLAEVRAARGHTEAALHDLDRITPLLVAVLGPGHRETLDALATRADALGTLERYAEAVRDQQAIQLAAVGMNGAGSWQALTALLNIAQLRCRAGDLAGGLDAAMRAHDRAAANFGGGNIMTQEAGREVAFCLLLSGRTDGVPKLLDAVDRQAVSQAFMVPDYGAQLDAMRAAVLLRTGHGQAAAALLSRAAPMLTRPQSEPFIRKWVLRLLAECAAWRRE